MATNVKWLPRANLFGHAFAIIRETLRRIIEGFFGFSTAAAQRRGVFRFLFFLVVLVVLTGIEINQNDIGKQLYQRLLEVWREAKPFDERLATTLGFISVFSRTAISLSVIRDFLVIFVPYLLALEFAAIYQHDVFEKDINTTRTFINQAVFASYYHVIHVREGKVIEANENSPILQIGGPGLVEVELDSAIMLEDADLKPRIIGPTGKQPWGKATVHGFERIRQSFDLRERSVTIPSIKARSRDGIEVEARDLHYVFSVHRGTATPTKANPYPFDENALINFVYNGGPPKGPGWKNPIATDMNMPISLELSGFISKRSIGEFLASVGQPELEAYEQRKNARDAAVRQLAGEAQQGETEVLPKTDNFAARPKISELFTTESFLKNVTGKGFSLRWVGVGTWNTDAKVIPELHLEAWEVSRSNVMRGDEKVLKKIQENAKYDYLLELLAQVVLDPYYAHAEEADSSALVNRWIIAYYERLKGLQESFDKSQPAPETLTRAVNILKEVLPYHEAGGEDEE